MEHILEIKQTDPLSYICSVESESIHAITADHLIDDIMIQQAYRVLKPGGFIFVMSLPREMYHNGGVLIQNRFTIIDSIHWLQTDTPDNSFSVQYLVDRMAYLSDAEKMEVKEVLKDLRCPKLRRSHIPIIIAQKPPSRNQTMNHFKEGVGLLQSIKTASGRNAGNVFSTEFDICPWYFLIPRIKDFERELFARAWTHILNIFTTDATIILDITRGHQSALSCIHLDRRYKACMESTSFEPFLTKCATFLKRQITDKERWSIAF